MATAHGITMLVVGGWKSSSPWAAESWSNTLKFDLSPVLSQPDVNAGSVNLTDFTVSPSSGTFSHTTGAYTWAVSRGWKVDGVTDNDGWFKAVLNAWRTWFVTISSYYAKDAEVRSIRFYPFGDLGKNPLTSGPTMAVPTPFPAGAATNNWSPDISVCISLYSADRSKHGRGRFYFGPLGQLTLDANGLLGSGLRDLIGNPFAAYLTELRDAQFDSGITVSQKQSSPVILRRTAPFDTGAVISKIRVGDEVDRQERRTKSRPETFTDVAVT